MYDKQIMKIMESSLGEELLEQADSIKREEDLFLLGLDSMNVIRLIIGIEDEFGIEFLDHEIAKEHWRSIQAIDNIIQRKKDTDDLSG